MIAPMADDIPFAPLPCKTNVVSAVGAGGERKVILRVSTPQGVTVLGLGFDPDHAARLAAELGHHAQQARTPGLVVAQPAQAAQVVQHLRNGAK